MSRAQAFPSSPCWRDNRSSNWQRSPPRPCRTARGQRAEPREYKVGRGTSRVALIIKDKLLAGQHGPHHVLEGLLPRLALRFQRAFHIASFFERRSQLLLLLFCWIAAVSREIQVLDDAGIRQADLLEQGQIAIRRAQFLIQRVAVYDIERLPHRGSRGTLRCVANIA